MMRPRPFVTCLLLGFGATYFGCAPTAQQQQQRRPAAGALAERACLEAATAETAAARKQAAFRLRQTDFPERQTQLVELQRMRSRIATGRMPDEELVAWGQVATPPEQPAPEPVPADSQQNVQPTGATQPGEPATAMQEATVAPDTLQAATSPVLESAPAPAMQETTVASDTSQAAASPVLESAPAPAVEPAPSQEPAPSPESEPAPAPAVEAAPNQEPTPAPPATEQQSGQ